MFRYNDKLTLMAINFLNKKGDISNYRLSFPIDKEKLDIPKDIIKLSIFEYHEGYETYGHEIFKICVGNLTSIARICKNHEYNYDFLGNIAGSIKSPNDKLCYYDNELGKRIIFAKINEEDRVVSNIGELKDTLIDISDNFMNIKTSILRLKNYKK